MVLFQLHSASEADNDLFIPPLSRSLFPLGNGWSAKTWAVPALSWAVPAERAAAAAETHSSHCEWLRSKAGGENKTEPQSPSVYQRAEGGLKSTLVLAESLGLRPCEGQSELPEGFSAPRPGHSLPTPNILLLPAGWIPPVWHTNTSDLGSVAGVKISSGSSVGTAVRLCVFVGMGTSPFFKICFLVVSAWNLPAFSWLGAWHSWYLCVFFWVYMFRHVAHGPWQTWDMSVLFNCYFSPLWGGQLLRHLFALVSPRAEWTNLS